jgi:hypothetical protein
MYTAKSPSFSLASYMANVAVFGILYRSKVNEFMDALDVALKYADKEGGQSK